MFRCCQIFFSLNIGRCTFHTFDLPNRVHKGRERKGTICRTETIGKTAVDGPILFHLIAVSLDLSIMPRSTGRAEFHHPEQPQYVKCHVVGTILRSRCT